MSSSSSPSIPGRVYAFLCSYGLATTLLFSLLLLTFLGTLEQVEHGLFESQKKYFESWVITSIDLGGCLRAMGVPANDMALPILLPGGLLAMVVLTISMICGGLVRIRKNPRTIGVIIAHFSIVFMLISGAVEYGFKKEGQMTLLEGQTSDEFQSFHNRVIEVEQVDPPAKDGKRSVVVIRDKFFGDLTPTHSEGKARTFTHSSLPFELVLKNYQENCEPRATDGSEGREPVDGYYLQPKPYNTTAEQNIDGIEAVVKDKAGVAQKGLLWGMAAAPWTVKVDGKTFLIDLTRERWTLPFSVRLDKFEHELHPGTRMSRKFSSQVTKIVGGHEEKHLIKMNEPLRDSGYALFQHSFGGDAETPGQRQQSTLEVVQNPSDNWPLYSCIAVAIGLLIHFVSMLARFIGRSNTAKAA